MTRAGSLEKKMVAKRTMFSYDQAHRGIIIVFEQDI